MLQNIYGKNLEEEKKKQEQILRDIDRKKQMEHFLKLQDTLNRMRR